MRTTIRIEDSLLADLRRRARDERCSLTELVNRALRRGVRALGEDETPLEPWLSSRTEADWTEVYRNYLATLRTLEGGRHDRPWVLKCPLHPPRLGVLRALVPRAVYVQTYRVSARSSGRCAA